jgi:hypothetical protein
MPECRVRLAVRDRLHPFDRGIRYGAAAVVIGMFLLRRDKKKPIIGALAVGAAIAFALYGTCLIIIAKST